MSNNSHLSFVGAAVAILPSLALAGCDQSNNDLKANERSKKSLDLASCTVPLAAWPIRVKIVGELEKIGTRTLCEQRANKASSVGELSLDGLNLALGTPVDHIYSAARKSGGIVVNTYAGKAILFDEIYDLPEKNDEPWASKTAQESRRYWLNSDNGKLIGFRACITYGAGGYRNQLNEQFAESFGPPRYIKTIAKISWAPELRMLWDNGGVFRTSNDPNTARLDFGRIPETFNWSDVQKTFQCIEIW